jgi:hypothetical protein
MERGQHQETRSLGKPGMLAEEEDLARFALINRERSCEAEPLDLPLYAGEISRELQG